MPATSGSWLYYGAVGQTYEDIFDQLYEAQKERQDIKIGDIPLLNTPFMKKPATGDTVSAIFNNNGIQANGDTQTVSGWIINPATYETINSLPISSPTIAQINASSSYLFSYPDGSSGDPDDLVFYWRDFLFYSRYAHGFFTHTKAGSISYNRNSYSDDGYITGTDSEAGAIASHNSYYSTNDPYDISRMTVYFTTGSGGYSPFYMGTNKTATTFTGPSTSDFNEWLSDCRVADYNSGTGEHYMQDEAYLVPDIDGASYTDQGIYPTVKAAASVRSITILTRDDLYTDDIEGHSQNASGIKPPLPVASSNLTTSVSEAFNGPPWQTSSEVYGNSYLIGDIGKVTSLFNYSFSDW